MLKARKVFSNPPRNSGSEPGFEMDTYKPHQEECEGVRVRTRVHKPGSASNLENFVEDDDKRSDLEYEVRN